MVFVERKIASYAGPGTGNMLSVHNSCFPIMRNASDHSFQSRKTRKKKKKNVTQCRVIY